MTSLRDKVAGLLLAELKSGASLQDKVAGLLLAELKSGAALQWFYISVLGDEGFRHGCYLQARGQTEAWLLLHNLDWCPLGSETLIIEVPPDKEHNIRDDQKWRKLTREEL